MDMIVFNSDTTAVLTEAESREWIVTNGLGGYASGTIAGSLTRGYHGLLMGAITPPTDRRLMSAKLEDNVQYQGQSYALATNRWNSGAIAPEGYKYIDRFQLDGSIPTWRYKIGETTLEKRIWMEPGKNTTYISYTLPASATEPADLTCTAVCNNRPLHNTNQLDWPKQVEAVPNGVIVTPQNDHALPLTMLMQKSVVTTSTVEWDNFFLLQEQLRGLVDTDRHVQVATFQTTLQPGETRLFLASAEENPAIDQDALETVTKKDQQLLKQWEQTSDHENETQTPDWLRQFILAADQFIVDREITEPGSNGANQTIQGKSVIAGYHWFGDWGRDTMISLPGLTLVTGRSQDARTILSTFSNFISQGMLPNNFPDSSGIPPEYNTLDATLWYFIAIQSYFQTTSDLKLLKELYPKLQDIITKHVEGTGRYNIKLDTNDNLLSGGTEGVQLTWMDAKVGDKVITPRIGKPVEISALWYNALKAMDNFAQALGEEAHPYTTMADATLRGFQRFWNAEKGYCYDVLDGPSGNDTLLRPNQIFAVSLPESPLTAEQQKSVVDNCTQHLLTPNGLRSLATFEPEYIGIYQGDQSHRDSAYHQGTVWGWLIGPYIKAHWKVYQDLTTIQKLFENVSENLAHAGLGSFSEIFDGDTPHTPKGCVAQAWSVAQVLEAYDFVYRKKHP